MTYGGRVKVLIVDDSPFVRSILARALSSDPGIEIIGGAKDPFEAREMIISKRPHVIILDIEMPRMDGLTFLKKLMTHYPVPVIMCSGVAEANSATALHAMELGAFDIVGKPDGGTRALPSIGEELADKIRAAASSGIKRPEIHTRPNTKKVSSFRAIGARPENYVIAIGASTGGTEAIKTVLCNMPADSPPIVMVQHMPEGFTRAFANRLNDHCDLHVSEAVDGDVLTPGRALLARGGTQMTIKPARGNMVIRYTTSEPVNRHCPSVEVLFDSVAQHVGRNAVGVILTGMGGDGAEGLLRMRQAGAITVGQDESSCIVYGMPKVAYEIGAVQTQAPLVDVARKTIQGIQNRDTSRVASAS